MNFKDELKRKEFEFDKFKHHLNIMYTIQSIPKKIRLSYEDTIETLLNDIIFLQRMVKEVEAIV